ncbi:WD40 repeat domain-containing protein, partial [Salmonella sp. s51228]|uniref:WD40 repeat domain-containing protein n=1 Tax=Salmonella sp. s51228 TaxID=3159652 RepID=UPI00397E966E
LSVKFSPCGQYVLAGYHNGILVKYSTEDGSVVVQQDKRELPANCVAWCPGNNEYCIAGYEDGLVIAYNAENGEALRHLKSHTQSVTCIDWNRHHVATGSADFMICLWPSIVQGGKKVKTEVIGPDCELKGHTGIVKGLSFSPDGIRLASVGQDCAL